MARLGVTGGMRGLRGFAAVTLIVLTACAPAAAPSPTAAPAAKPTESPKPAAASAPAPTPAAAATKPEQPAAAAAKPASSPAAAAKPDSTTVLNDLYQKAKAAGATKVVHYGGGLGSEYDQVVAAFQKRFPDISVETVNLRGPEILQRLGAEAASGRYIATVVSAGATTMLQVEQGNFLADWDGPPNKADLPAIPLTEGRTRWAYGQQIYGYVANTKLTPADKLPTKRQDLLDPFWKGPGKLLIEDPRAGGPGLEFFTIAADQLGRGFLEQIKAQQPTFVRERDAAPAQIARGEFAMFIPSGITREVYNLQQTAPVKVDWLRDGGATTVAVNLGVVKNAPGQDAAKLWVSWLTSPEGQQAYTNAVQDFAVLPGITPPPGMPAPETLKPSSRSAEQIQKNNDYIKLFEEIYFS